VEPEIEHPAQLLPYIGEIRAFAEHTYHHVVYRILKLVSLALDLPEDFLWGLHDHEGAIGAACQRFMGYFPRPVEHEKATEGIWSKGHTDCAVQNCKDVRIKLNVTDNSISLLYSQPISALQILTKDDEWRWVKHVEGAGEVLSRCHPALAVGSKADRLLL
jgi:hypothetical protein